jgi:hypothetical protein
MEFVIAVLLTAMCAVAALGCWVWIKTDRAIHPDVPPPPPRGYQPNESGNSLPPRHP